MSQRNQAVVRRLVDEVVAGDYLGRVCTSTGEVYGREGYRRFYAALRQAFPDFRFTVEDQIAEGDLVVTRWAARGTHTGELRGIPPTGEQGCISGMSIDRLADGKVVECWVNSDELGLLQQLGVVPTPERVGDQGKSGERTRAVLRRAACPLRHVVGVPPRRRAGRGTGRRGHRRPPRLGAAPHSVAPLLRFLLTTNN
jgi:predicted ester cyclase